MRLSLKVANDLLRQTTVKQVQQHFYWASESLCGATQSQSAKHDVQDRDWQLLTAARMRKYNRVYCHWWNCWVGRPDQVRISSILTEPLYLLLQNNILTKFRGQFCLMLTVSVFQIHIGSLLVCTLMIKLSNSKYQAALCCTLRRTASLCDSRKRQCTVYFNRGWETITWFFGFTELKFFFYIASSL